MKDSNFYRKGTDPKVPLFVYLSPPLLKNLSDWIIQICQNQNSIPFRKKYYYFLHYLGYFWQETGRCHKWKDQNQNLTYSFSPTIVGQLPWKKIGSNAFQFCSHRSQRVFKSGCFFWYHTYIFEKKMNRISWCRTQFWIDWHQLQIPKWKIKKLVRPFLIALSSRDQFNLTFFLFSGQFWTVEKFLPSRSEAKKKVAGLHKKCLFGL